MANTEYDALVEMLVPRVLERLVASSTAAGEIERVQSLDNIKALAAYRRVGGTEKTVEVPITLLSQPAWDAVAGHIRRLEEAIGSVDGTVAKIVGASDELAALKRATEEAKTASSNAASSSAAAMRSARTAEGSAAETDAVRRDTLAVLEKVRQVLADGLAEIADMRAVRQIITADAQFAPSRLEVVAPKRITATNRVPQRIAARVFPAYLVQNVLYRQPINGGSAVAVSPDGSLEILGTGKSRIHVVAAGNTALWQTVEVEVKEPDVRLTASGAVRLTSGGAIRLT